MLCAGEAIEMIMEDEFGKPQVEGEEQKSPGFLSSLGSTFASLQRFGRSLSQ